MALPSTFLEELRARTPLAALIGRRVKLAKSGRNWTGCCPFHNEKTPSFYVYDDHFHCYGCGKHGDAITFVSETGGGSFMDAVEQLAREAGLEVPKASPAQARAEQRRLDLQGILERAQEAFVRRLHAPEGAAALDYLRRRGLTDDTIARFGLGWSGDGRGGLIAELRAAGAEIDQMLEAGLLREAEDGTRRELYWGRVTFPIRDRRGRLISFGGRALGDAKPKYINGPDTPLFAKRRTLYGLDLARASRQAIVVEGYMDVIALQQAGFAGAVAPLGTALTPEQLAELWRIDPAPVLCFDGDAAGGRAAERAMMLALPELTPEQTLKIARLPAGEDPDSLLRARGADAFRTVLADALPLADALYAALSQGVSQGMSLGGAASPEQRAALRRRLEDAARAIQDRGLSAEYRNALLGKFFAGRGRKGAPAAASPARARGSVGEDRVGMERARLLMILVLRCPSMLRGVEAAFAGLELPADLMALREHILDLDDDALLDSQTLLAHLDQSGAAQQAAALLPAPPKPAGKPRPDIMRSEAEAEWWHIYGLMHRARLEDELASACSAFAAVPDEASQRRLIALRTELADLTDPDRGAPS